VEESLTTERNPVKLPVRLAAIAAASAAAVLAFAAPALAGSPHFVGTPVFTTSGSTVTVSAKEAGLGNEVQVHVVLSGTAQCVNPGGNDPQAGNKTAVAQAADEPVQNGKADYSVTATAVLQPACSPPMTIVFTDLTLTDTTNGLTAVPVPAP
jgi:polyisoprenoid-binding protein YceI